MNIYLYILVAVAGLISGSFASALIYRLPRNLSIAKGRSMCPRCKKKISWYDNIPLVSYFLLKGKCRHCKKRISKKYPFLEALFALGFVATYYFFSKKLISVSLSFSFFDLFVLFVLFFLSLVIFFIDFENMIIPDSLVFSGFVFLVMWLIFFYPGLFYKNLLASFLSSGTLLLIVLITKGKGMGLGDVKFALFSGAFLGPKLIFPFLFFAFLFGAFVGLFLLFFKRAKLGRPIPFGPFLSFSFLFTIYMGTHFLYLFPF